MNRLVNVTHLSHLWCDSDPIRPELNVEFKTAPGRGVLALVDEHGKYNAFLCFAIVKQVPRNIGELERFTSRKGKIVVPYTVWSLKRGSGREIIQLVIENLHSIGKIHRVVTLSPQTEMAKAFHLRNGAIELQRNEYTVNFEYKVSINIVPQAKKKISPLLKQVVWLLIFSVFLIYAYYLS